MKKKFLVLLILLASLFLVRDVYGYISWRKADEAYKKCVNTPGSTNMEPIPPVCWYEDGTKVVGSRNPSGITHTLFD